MRFTSEHRRALIDQFAAGPARLRAVWEAVPPDARCWRPAPDAWSPHEIVVHCADSEGNSHWRIRSLLAQPEVPIQGYDEPDWAIRFGYLDHPADVALAFVEAVRANTTSLIRRLTEEQWATVGRHSESGRYSAEDWLEIYASHCHDHAGQIERAVADWRQAVKA